MSIHDDHLDDQPDPITLTRLLDDGYSDAQARWLIARACRGTGAEPYLMPDELERLLPDLPSDDELGGDA